MVGNAVVDLVRGAEAIRQAAGRAVGRRSPARSAICGISQYSVPACEAHRRVTGLVDLGAHEPATVQHLEREAAADLHRVVLRACRAA